jgi:tRNA nucleotidyltransferase/poly(A) polymerase
MNAEEIIMKLQDNGFEAYLVGGYVRDMILGIKSKDKDITTNADPETLEKLFKDQDIKSAGKSFLVTFINGIEVATFRTDHYSGLNDKNVKIEKARTAEEDAKRRDFTINSLFFDPIKNQIIDYVGGQEDLKNKIIRFTGNSQHRIWEDPNRIIRACRFLAKIDGDFEKETFETLKKYSDYVSTMVKPERIRLELIKAMSIKKASLFFRALHDIDALKYILPSMETAYLHPGGPYHIEDVFDHLMMAGDHCSIRYPIEKLAAYLHDIGKPISSRINPRTDDLWFEGHEETGFDASRIELENLRFSLEEINIISYLIKLHMRISYSRMTPKGIRRTLKTLYDAGISYKSLLRVSICDKMGGLKSQKHYSCKDVMELVGDFRKVINEKPAKKFGDLKLNGNDVMEITGLKPSPKIGEILNYLLDRVLDEPELNEKEKLIELMKEKLNG